MKKIIILIFTLMMFAVIGCGGKPPTGPVSSVTTQCLAGAPDWVLAGNAEGGFTAVGAARMSQAGLQFTRTQAMGNARDEMARSIEVRVSNMLKDFTQSTGIGDDETIDRVTSSVSRQVSQQTLQGTVQRAIWQSPCDEFYVLIAVDPNAVQQSVRDTVNSSFRNENALWQQFQAQNAHNDLEAAINAEFR